MSVSFECGPYRRHTLSIPCHLLFPRLFRIHAEQRDTDDAHIVALNAHVVHGAGSGIALRHVVDIRSAYDAATSRSVLPFVASCLLSERVLRYQWEEVSVWQTKFVIVAHPFRVDQPLWWLRSCNRSAVGNFATFLLLLREVRVLKYHLVLKWWPRVERLGRYRCACGEAFGVHSLAQVSSRSLLRSHG